MSARLLAAVLSLALAVPVVALGAQRTFVASNGVDTNACSLASPCRSFTAALAHTAPSGEIIVLDSAGYGPVTIGQSVSITAPPGVYAGISVFSGDGVSVNAAGVDVALRGLTINGQGGVNGIAMASGSTLTVERCTVSAMSGSGLVVTASFSAVLVSDCTFQGNGVNGILVNANPVKASIERVRVEGSTFSGILVEGGASATIRDSAVFANGNNGISVFSSGPVSEIAVSDSVVSGHTADASGISALSSGAGTALLTVTRTTVSRNSGGISVGSSGGATTHATVSDSAISANFGDGLTVYGGAVLAASNNTIGKNVTGVSNTASTFQTRQNNTSSGNTTALTGAFTPLSGF